MKTGLSFLSAASAALLLGSAASVPAAGSPGEDYLFRLVPARSDVRFVSFGPKDPQDWFWRDEPRTNAWRRRVAGKLGIPPESVRVQRADAPMPVLPDGTIAPADLFAKRIKRGDRALSVVNGRSDDGAPSVRTNAFVVSRFENDGVSDVELAWRPSGRFRLRTDQGAGEDIWMMSWDELRKQWDSEAPETVRKELWELNRFCETADRPRPGAARWHDRFLDYWKNHPALWPGFVVRNDQPNPVLVRYRLRTADGSAPWSQDLPIPANGEKPVSPLADPHAGYLVEWMFRPEGGHCPLCCKVQDDWNVNGYHSALTVTIPGPRDVSPYKDPPILEFDESFLPYKDLSESFERIVESVSVVYGDGTVATQSVQRLSDEDGLPFIRIVPDRSIREVVFPGSSSFDGQAHRPAREDGRYHCGERATLKGTLRRPPWPTVTIHPELSPDSIRHEATASSVHVTIRVSDELPSREFEPLERSWDLKVGSEKTISLETDLDGLAALPRKDGVRLTVSVSAPQFEVWTAGASIARGGDPQILHPVLDPKTEPWPWKELEKAIRSTPQFNAVLTPQNRRTQHRGDGDDSLAAQIWEAFSNDDGNKVPKAKPLDGLKHHLDVCPGCKECKGFVTSHDGRLAKGETGGTDRLSVLLAAWEEVYPARAKAACERQDVEQAVKDTTRTIVNPKTKKPEIVPASSNIAVLEAVMRDYLNGGATP